jgi:hypothetical protein
MCFNIHALVFFCVCQALQCDLSAAVSCVSAVSCVACSACVIANVHDTMHEQLQLLHVHAHAQRVLRAFNNVCARLSSIMLNSASDITYSCVTVKLQPAAH